MEVQEERTPWVSLEWKKLRWGDGQTERNLGASSDQTALINGWG